MGVESDFLGAYNSHGGVTSAPQVAALMNHGLTLEEAAEVLNVDTLQAKAGLKEKEDSLEVSGPSVQEALSLTPDQAFMVKEVLWSSMVGGSAEQRIDIAKFFMKQNHVSAETRTKSKFLPAQNNTYIVNQNIAKANAKADV